MLLELNYLGFLKDILPLILIIQAVLVCVVHSFIEIGFLVCEGLGIYLKFLNNASQKQRKIVICDMLLGFERLKLSFEVFCFLNTSLSFMKHLLVSQLVLFHEFSHLLMKLLNILLVLLVTGHLPRLDLVAFF